MDGKISTARKKRSRKLTRGASGKPTEPFIDYSITKPCFGISPYSKTDPKGELHLPVLVCMTFSMFGTKGSVLNPLSPNSDQDQISPNSIHTLSRDKL